MEKMFDLDVWQWIVLGYGILALIWFFTVIAFYEILKRVDTKPKELTSKQIRKYLRDIEKVFKDA